MYDEAAAEKYASKEEYEIFIIGICPPTLAITLYESKICAIEKRCAVPFPEKTGRRFCFGKRDNENDSENTMLRTKKRNMSDTNIFCLLSRCT